MAMKTIHIAGSAEVHLPELGQTDILVNDKAVSINLVEAKIRAGKLAVGQLPSDSILGLTAPVSFLFVPTHSNAEYVAANYHIIAPKPKPLSFEDVAAVPLTGMGNEPGALLVINGAGGVGSAGIQLAKAKGMKNIIATASRDIRLAMQGPLGSYDGLGAGQKKGVSFNWGFVFMRMECQGKALRDIARLFDEGKLRLLCRVLVLVTEAGETIGKVVLKVLEEGVFQ
ncbi:hypothetical protein BDQ17DRAFT_1336780 [Cyathus striatus]|nr:hypothetical protein BDQ17DRAFT_1336780 [Cyathus striatus]